MPGSTPVRLSTNFRKGQKASASEQNALGRMLNGAYGTNGVQVRPVGGRLCFSGAGTGINTKAFSLGQNTLNGKLKTVLMNGGWLCHVPNWYQIQPVTVTIGGGSLDAPHYVVLEYVHRSLARILPATLTSFTSTAGVTRIPLCAYYLKNGEVAARLPVGGIMWLGNIIMGGPLYA
jgi:hypothetical protein